MEPAGRLVYLTSGLHEQGATDLDDLDWTERPWDGRQAYADSKLFDATLAAAMARRRPAVADEAFGERLLDAFARLTGVPLP